MINLRLPWPPTVNTYYTVARGRKILSKRGREYKVNSIADLIDRDAPRGLEGRFEVNMDVYPPDRRKRDIDNLTKPVLDVLTNYGLWEDDSQVDVLRIRRMNIEKPGFVRVHITEIE